MISVEHMTRMSEGSELRRMAHRVIANGRLDGPALRAALADSDACAPCALGLALQRCCELTYGPTEGTARLAARLQALQHEGGHGWFAPGSRHRVIATAIALRALLDHTSLHRPRGLGGPPSSTMSARQRWAARVQCAVAGAAPRPWQSVLRALAALESGVRQELSEVLASRASASLDSSSLAVVFWQLERYPVIARRLGLSALRHWIARSGPPSPRPHRGGRDADSVSRFVQAAA